MTSVESFLTKAPMTPRDVRRRYSNGRDFEVVFRKGYRNSGICALSIVSYCSQMPIFFGEDTIEKQSTSLAMRSYTLQKCKRVANTV
jgi:hypothetical protein